MNSMTGYGRATASLDLYTLTVQVSSVNRKTLDLTVALPDVWESLEPAVGERVRKFALRGKIHVDVELTGDKGAAAVTWDEAAATDTFKRLASFAAGRGVPFTPSPELLWQLLNTQRKGAELPSAESSRDVLMTTLEDALRAFSAMRAKEGEALLVDFIKRLENLSKHVALVAGRAPQVPSGHRDALHKRLRDAGLELDLADDRVLKEIALFADRCDISEELTRLRSHFDQFSILLKTGAEVGRKAEFILQEIGREVHTIGSKANDLAISQNVIELKNELERIREQIANVE